MAKRIAIQSRGAKADSRGVSSLDREWITAAAAGTSFPELVESFLSSSGCGFAELLNLLTVRQREILVTYLLTRCRG